MYGTRRLCEMLLLTQILEKNNFHTAISKACLLFFRLQLSTLLPTLKNADSLTSSISLWTLAQVTLSKGLVLTQTGGSFKDLKVMFYGTVKVFFNKVYFN